MSKFRRGLLISNGPGSEPLDSSLIFWAPMEQGDLTDHVTGIQMQLTGNGVIEWDNNVGIYKITTPSTTYNTVLTFINPNRMWKNLIQDDYTVCAKICRFRNNYGTNNNCRVFACGPTGLPTDQWLKDGMGRPANNFVVAGGISGQFGNIYEQIYSFACATHYTGNIITIPEGTPDEIMQWYYKNGVMITNGATAAQSKFSRLSDEVNSGLNIGLTGHVNYRYCTFGIKDVRIYNRILTQQEIIEISQL